MNTTIDFPNTPRLINNNYHVTHPNNSSIPFTNAMTFKNTTPFNNIAQYIPNHVMTYNPNTMNIQMNNVKPLYTTCFFN